MATLGSHVGVDNICMFASAPTIGIFVPKYQKVIDEIAAQLHDNGYVPMKYVNELFEPKVKSRLDSLECCVVDGDDEATVVKKTALRREVSRWYHHSRNLDRVLCSLSVVTGPVYIEGAGEGRGAWCRVFAPQPLNHDIGTVEFSTAVMATWNDNFVEPLTGNLSRAVVAEKRSKWQVQMELRPTAAEKRALLSAEFELHGRYFCKRVLGATDTQLDQVEQLHLNAVAELAAIDVEVEQKALDRHGDGAGDDVVIHFVCCALRISLTTRWSHSSLLLSFLLPPSLFSSPPLLLCLYLSLSLLLSGHPYPFISTAYSGVLEDGRILQEDVEA